MKKTFFAVVLAGMCAVGANAACIETVSIGDKAGLDSFRDRVNKGENTLCAELTADIKYNGSNSLHNSSGNFNKYKYDVGTGLNSYNVWTPIEGFAGTFDGKGYDIVGLYMDTDTDAGLFKSVYGGAVIKNLNISDYYFRVSSARAAGLIVTVAFNEAYKDKVVIVDNCTVAASFGGKEHGTVVGGTKSNGASNIGGLVSVVSAKAKITISNSVNKGRVLAAYQNRVTVGDRNAVHEELVSGTNIGGLIAYVEKDAVANVANCYNTGKVDATGGSSYNSIVPTTSEGTLVKDNVACLSDVKGCADSDAKSQADLSKNYTAYNQSRLLAYYDEATINEMYGIQGVTFANEEGKLVATLSDADGALAIPQDINVDSVVLNRVFDTELSSSTVMLPFEIAATKVENAEFFNITGVTKTGGTAETEAATISAYKPYLVKPMQSSIGFKGAVTLKQTTASEETSYLVGEWSFRGRITNKIWREADVDGKAYTYSPKALSNGIAKGEFAKIGKNVRVKTMRAYLYYSGSSATPLAKARAGASLMSTEEIAVEDLPATIPMTFIHKEIVVKDDNEVASTEGEDKGTLSVAKPVKAMTVMKSNRWYDLKGRSLNGKPQNHGAFINNKTSVIVK